MIKEMNLSIARALSKEAVAMHSREKMPVN